MKNGIYIFENPDEFIQVMEKLQEEYLDLTSKEGNNSKGVGTNE